MNSKLGFHADRLQVLQLFLKSLNVLVPHKGRINTDHTMSMAPQGKPFPCEVKLLPRVRPMDLEICSEVISTECSRNESTFASLQDLIQPEHGLS